jgi:hypothetical protein
LLPAAYAAGCDNQHGIYLTISLKLPAILQQTANLITIFLISAPLKTPEQMPFSKNRIYQEGLIQP